MESTSVVPPGNVTTEAPAISPTLVFRLVTPQQYAVFNEIVTSLMVSMAVLGLYTNAVNIRVFVKIGYRDGVTTSFLFLSFVDWGFSAISLIQGLGSVFGIVEERYRVFFNVDPFAIYFFAGNLSVTVNIIVTSTITFITVVRCMCVAMPLHFKNMFTRKRILITLILIVIVTFISQVPIFAHMGMQSKFDPRVNSTRLVLWMSKDREKIRDAIRFTIGTPVLTALLAIDIICVFVIVLKLRQSLVFRRQTTTDTTPSDKGEPEAADKLTGKDLQVVIQVVLVCAILIVCNIPKLIATTLLVAEPDYEMGKPLQYLYFTVQAVGTFFDSVNSSVNFFVYFRFNSKFRAHVNFCGRNKEKQNHSRVV